MKISVIIPLYNVAAYIKQCILSVLNQTYEGEYEVIVIDDASPDNSVNVLKHAIKNHSRREIVKILHHKENKGQSAARNWGIREAKGEYIFFLDSDDCLELNALEELFSKAIDANVDFVCGECRIVRSQGEEFSSMYMRNGEFILGNEQIFEKRAYNYWSLVPWNKLIKKAFLIENNILFFERMYYEDVLWAFLVATKANKIAFISNITYTYFIRNNSTSTTMSDRHINSFVSLIREMFVIIDRDRLFEKYGGLVVKIYEECRCLAIDWTLPRISKEKGKSIVAELQKYNAWSIVRVLRCDFLSVKIKLKTIAFFIGILGYSYFRLFAKVGKYVCRK